VVKNQLDTIRNFFGKSYVQYAALFLGLIGLAVYFYSETISYFPSHIHAWTQSDRYALALNFINNGFDFFHPATYNHQTIDGITQVDFPIHDYTAAIFMKLFGTKAAWVFRCYTLLYSFVGLTFLYKLTKNITGSQLKAGIAVVFLVTTPVYTYYQAGFLPSVPSLANCIIGFYFYQKYLKGKEQKHFYYAVLFLTLAALARLPFTMILLAVSFNELLKIRFKPFPKTLIACGAGLSAVAIYFTYNQHLGSKYGTMFLTSTMHIESWDMLVNVLKLVKETWLDEYFTKYHYIAVLILLLLLVIRYKDFPELLKKYRDLLIVLIVSFMGAICYFLLMGKQFVHHDYYFLDSFMFPCIIAFILLLHFVEFKKQKANTVVLLMLAFFCVGFISNSKNSQEKRYKTELWDRVEITRKNFVGSAAFLNKKGISKDAKMLVLDAYTTNAPLILMDRKGYTVITTSPKNIAESLTWDFDYVVIQNRYLLSDVVRNRPSLMQELSFVASNGKIAVYKINQSKTPQDLKTFLGIKEELTVAMHEQRFEVPTDPNIWEKTTPLDSSSALTGNFALKHEAGNEFGLYFSTKNLHLSLTGKELLFFDGNIKLLSSNNDIKLVVAAKNEKGEDIHYDSYTLSEYLKPNNQWQNSQFQFNLPKLNGKTEFLYIYIWNPGKSEFLLDDFSYWVYSY
jgi:hypothetical protein